MRTCFVSLFKQCAKLHSVPNVSDETIKNTTINYSLLLVNVVSSVDEVRGRPLI